MSTPRKPQPAKLVIGLFMRERQLLEELAGALVEQFGDIDLVSVWMPFNYTDYYRPEMGAPLFRRMLAFKRLVAQDALPAVKRATNRMEQDCAVGGRRRVNIDPGYLLLERFVLASGKNFSHRIYLADGIYADLTLIYRQGMFQKRPWTYPDYADEPMVSFLKQVREKYRRDLKSGVTEPAESSSDSGKTSSNFSKGTRAS